MINAYEVTLLGVNTKGQRHISIVRKHQFKDYQQLEDYSKANGFGGMLAPNQTIISDLTGFCVLNPEKI